MKGNDSLSKNNSLCPKTGSSMLAQQKQRTHIKNSKINPLKHNIIFTCLSITYNLFITYSLLQVCRKQA